MTFFELEQAVIQKYTAPRVCTCTQIPDYFPLVNVRLPNTMKDQSVPIPGSLVLVGSIDNHQHYIIAVLREPSPTFNQNTDQTLNSDSQYRGDTLQPGEVFIQANGTPNQGTGLDASLYISNAGTIELTSSAGTEQIVIGGTASDDQDHEIIITAPNMSIESPLEAAVSIQSTFNYDDLNNLQIANTSVTAATDVGLPISELTMDALGGVVLRNTTFGVDKSFLKLNTSSDVQLGNLLSKLELDPSGNATLNATTVNINNGVNGAARLNDSTFSSLVQDPTFWSFIQNLFVVFNAHVHTSASPGNPTTPPLTPLLTYPLQMNGIISTSSATVTIGN